MKKTGKVTPLRARRSCPVCGKPSTRDSYPFCSVGCKDVDLDRWLTGRYVIPANEDDDASSDDRE